MTPITIHPETTIPDPETGCQGRPPILDNQTGMMAGSLRPGLAGAGADDFYFVSAYFTIHGQALLADQLDHVGAMHFLFGDPSSLDNLDTGG